MTIKNIFIYPIKSIRGIAIPEVEVQTRGLAMDRRWMLVDREGVFLTQRTFAKMALLQPNLHENQLEVTTQDTKISPIFVSRIPTIQEEALIPVQIWKDSCMAWPYPKEINQWFSEVLDQDVRLVYLPETSTRPIKERFYRPGDYVSLADAYPVLLANTSSLEDFNTRLEKPIPIQRIRPNILVEHDVPYAEDDWLDFTIGNVRFRGTEPCARCQVLNINPQTTLSSPETLKTLSSYRKKENNVYFGLNACLHDASQAGLTLRVGDELTVLEQRIPSFWK